MNIRRPLRWKTWIISGAVVVSGMVTVAAGDNYFEISKNLEIFTELYKELNVYYVEDTKPGTLIKTGIDAMLISLDPYTQYIPESDIEEYRFQTTGQYGGIGALIKRSKEGGMQVSEPYEGYPAAKSGIWAGDEILEVEGRKVAGMDTEEVSKLLKGQAGTNVKLVLRRDGGAPQEKVLVREEIKIPDVPYKGMLDAEKKIGYIKLNSFTQTAGSDVRAALKELKEQGAEKMVLDLRGNGGGLLREAVNIVNLFVPKNELVVETKGRIAEWDKSYRTLSEPFDDTMPLVVLVDGGSASASEIVSGALQDLDRAVIIGERTFGKGLVQQTRDLFYNSKLKVTVAKYYIPSGRCIQKLDYAHRDSAGKAVERTDTSLVAFKTKAGRTVYDGRGIWPDRKVEEPELAKVVGGLYADDVFFDFATQYRRSHDSIGPAESFTISEALYQEFTQFAKGRSFTYDTESMEVYAELAEVAKKERYYEHAQAAFETLKKELTPDPAEELVLFRADVEELLRNEIVARYHLQTGRAKAALVTDPYVKSALQVFGDGSYDTILKGQ
ncbi:MAG: S41 family peptidase [Flavobacteriales bacterium]|jgi:carboxyl-terminal processing protease|nr:S41 family peptidase [Flavobacteriales bacterium]MBK6753163.1 S41 family peptidase [Flavobacteriales bacterium]MBK7085102.1 S41 family peptidase [Flavobacteriales bacterium]MBK7752646.1 S41 family peptidase [Flavobacteriales bacterium]MBK9076684.1 S41 family peptidase [Flavobacteriales bacterium]